MAKRDRLLEGVGRVRDIARNPSGDVFVAVEGAGKIFHLVVQTFVMTLTRWTMTSWAMLSAMTTFAQDWDHRHAFAKSYWGSACTACLPWARGC